jgi:hypothetical protein
VYVVPAFEVDVSVRGHLPTCRRDLIRLYNNNRAVYFHAKTCKQCQKFPKLKQWVRTKIEPGIHIISLLWLLLYESLFQYF